MVKFDFYLDLDNVKDEKNKFDIAKLDFYFLKREISNGRLFIILDDKDFIKLETGIIDCIIQFNDVITTIDSGTHETFSVSWDYYSNRINYEYNSNLGTLRIMEVHEQEFDVIVNFNEFKQGFQLFKRRAFKELSFHYPSLKDNKIFQMMCKGELRYDILKDIK